MSLQALLETKGCCRGCFDNNEDSVSLYLRSIMSSKVISRRAPWTSSSDSLGWTFFTKFFSSVSALSGTELQLHLVEDQHVFLVFSNPLLYSLPMLLGYVLCSENILAQVSNFHRTLEKRLRNLFSFLSGVTRDSRVLGWRSKSWGFIYSKFWIWQKVLKTLKLWAS